MKLHVIDTGYFKLDGGAMFGVVPKTIWNKLNPADENNRCNWSLRCLLIEDGRRLILIDTGLGNKQDEKFFRHYDLNGNDSLNNSLARRGFSPGDITDVFLTHLHFDHCGGAIMRRDDKLLPAFPNAVYWSNERHWKWATLPNDREKASFLTENIIPIQQSGQLRFIEDPIIPVSDFPEYFTIRLCHGHTESMMLPQIRYKGRTIVFMADLLPSAAHIPLPYVLAYDMFPLTTLEEKKLFSTEALKGNYVLFFEHDPLYECCELQDTARGIQAARTFRLQDL